MLEKAVLSGGGDVSAVEDAEAIIWAGEDPSELGTILHEGIRWVQLATVGIEEYLEAHIIDRGRIWTAAKGVYSEVIADHALAFVLAAARQLPAFIRSGRWSEPRGVNVSGQTVGVIGAGGIGSAILRRAHCLGTATIAVNRSGRPVHGADRCLSQENIGLLLQESDYVVLATPATRATRGMMGWQQFDRMKSDAWLINVARGSLVVTADLVEALSERSIGGAALDVTDPEPLPESHPLWDMDNVMITPHTAAFTAEMGFDLFAPLVRANVACFAEGAKLTGLVDVDREY